MLHEKFHVGYATGILITTTIPAIAMPVDDPDVARFIAQPLRAVSLHSRLGIRVGLAGVSSGGGHRLAVADVRRIVLTGLGNAGGVLAWNLGHQDFAPPGRDSQYMGVHVTLTGIRGLMAPFLAVGIYQWLDQDQTALAGAGMWVFAVCLVLNVVGAIGLRRHWSRRKAHTLGCAPTASPSTPRTSGSRIATNSTSPDCPRRTDTCLRQCIGCRLRRFLAAVASRPDAGSAHRRIINPLVET